LNELTDVALNLLFMIVLVWSVASAASGDREMRERACAQNILHRPRHHHISTRTSSVLCAHESSRMRTHTTHTHTHTHARTHARVCVSRSRRDCWWHVWVCESNTEHADVDARALHRRRVRCVSPSAHRHLSCAFAAVLVHAVVLLRVVRLTHDGLVCTVHMLRMVPSCASVLVHAFPLLNNCCVRHAWRCVCMFLGWSTRDRLLVAKARGWVRDIRVV
jgi:hypothetical protein